MGIAELIHIFYSSFGTTKGQLKIVDLMNDCITVRIQEETYTIGRDLDCWQQTGHGPQRGPEERKISATLHRGHANYLDGASS